jgi:hypothetical protein
LGPTGRSPPNVFVFFSFRLLKNKFGPSFFAYFLVGTRK